MAGFLWANDRGGLSLEPVYSLRVKAKFPLPRRAKSAAGGYPRKMRPHFAWAREGEFSAIIGCALAHRPLTAMPTTMMAPGGDARTAASRFTYIAIHRKFQTRRAAEDSTRLYGEAAQHSMRLSVDGYTYTNPATLYVNHRRRVGLAPPR